MRGRVLGIDPGVRGCGCAISDLDGVLAAATYVVNPVRHTSRLDSAVAMAKAVTQWARGCAATQDFECVAIEVPRSYSAGQQKGPQNDLIDVAMVAAACAALMELPVFTYYPQEWKGTVDPETMLERILKRLSKVEKDRIELVGRVPLEQVPASDSLDHNTIDACGIVLHALGRMTPVKVYARE